MDFNKIGGRKFISTVIILLIGAVLQGLNKFTAEFGVFLASVLAVFSGSNAYLSAKTAGMVAPEQAAETPTESVAPEVPTAQAAIDPETRALIEQIAVTVGQTQQILINAMQAGQQQK